ncbi:hypothetical protein M3Y97_00971600 [Aphelenchoides bicaudatus]|nr:hypothetical protein M3Y97_00971600 [Aphelenchoides bicaudatus]
MFRIYLVGTTAFVSTAGLVVFNKSYRSAYCQHNMSNFDRAKAEAQQIASDMRSSADKMRQNIESTFKQESGPYSYTKITQQLRLGQLIALPLQALALYMEADRVGLLGFLVPFSLIAVNAYLTFTKWQKNIDGRSEAQTLVNSRNTQQRSQAGIQVFGAFILALLVHLVSPRASASMLGSLIFNLADYLIIAAAFCLYGFGLVRRLEEQVTLI